MNGVVHVSTCPNFGEADALFACDCFLRGYESQLREGMPEASHWHLCALANVIDANPQHVPIAWSCSGPYCMIDGFFPGGTPFVRDLCPDCRKAAQ